MTKVILDKGTKVRVWEDLPARAARRAKALAELHSTEAVQDKDGDWYVDASHYYKGET